MNKSMNQTLFLIFKIKNIKYVIQIQLLITEFLIFKGQKLQLLISSYF